MKITYITAGAGGMYCGSCIRDNALAAALTERGHDVTLLPLYTPTRTDEENVSQHRVFLRRHQRVSGAICLAVSQDALAARPALGVAVAAADRLGARGRDTTGAARGADGVGARGRARPPAEGARQARALAARTAASRRARHLELDADRHCRTAQGRAGVSDRLHVAGRERVHGAVARAVSVPGEGVDPVAGCHTSTRSWRSATTTPAT